MPVHADTQAPTGTRLIGGLLMLLVMGAHLGWADARSAPPIRGVAASEPASVRSLGERVVRVLRVLMERPAAQVQAEPVPPPNAHERSVYAGVTPQRGAPRSALGPWLVDLPPPAC